MEIQVSYKKKRHVSFEHNAEDYKGLEKYEKNRLLVERVETIVSSKTSKYFSMLCCITSFTQTIFIHFMQFF